MQNIRNHNHFGKYGNGYKDLDDELWELKFNDGSRVYYVHTGEDEITLLRGGNKNSQKEDIKKSKGMIERGEI